MISPTLLRPSSMASAFSILIIFISSTIILCCARGTSYNADIAKKQAQRLIRSFNLSPEKSFNFVHDNESEPARLVEKPFKFPVSLILLLSRKLSWDTMLVTIPLNTLMEPSKLFLILISFPI
ncbi:hypothetical protein QQ045_025772 [Rhodiola kirilowii]